MKEALTPPGPPLPRSEGEGGEGALPLARPWRERGLGGEGSPAGEGAGGEGCERDRKK